VAPRAYHPEAGRTLAALSALALLLASAAGLAGGAWAAPGSDSVAVTGASLAAAALPVPPELEKRGSSDSVVPPATPRVAARLLPPAPAAAAALHAAPGFVLRRVPNPRHRSVDASARAMPAALMRLRAIDRLKVQVTHVRSGAGRRLTDWRIEGGEEYRERAALSAVASGTNDGDRSRLRTLRLDAGRGGLSGSFGDVPPVTVERFVSLQHLRGAVVEGDLGGGAWWRALGGGPTPTPGQPTPRAAIAGWVIDGARVDDARLSLALFGFRRGAPTARSGDPDSLAGRGGQAVIGITAPLPMGSLALRLAAGHHDLDGHGGLTAGQITEWNLSAPRLVIALRDERATRRARVIGSDDYRATPRREDRWNVQARPWSGRAEAHFTGVVRAADDPALSARTIQLGGSGTVGRSRWYAGAEAGWDDRPLTGELDRRLSLQAGRSWTAGHALLARLDRNTGGAGRDQLQATVELSLALRRRLRLGLEPRLWWDARRLAQGALEARLTAPLPWLGTRLAAGVVLAAAAERGFRGELREATLAVSLAPRARDRGDLEIRRVSDGGTGHLEYDAGYEMVADRYESLVGGSFARRDSSRVTVLVLRSGNRSGAPNVLVSLDGKELRFTDEDGVARFDHVSPGVHVVALEERSLPPQQEVVGASRVFVTLERGHPPEAVEFTIARPARRSTF